MTTTSEPIESGGFAQPAGATSSSEPRLRSKTRRHLRDSLRIGLQLLGLWAISAAGSMLVRLLALPVPGNLAGMMLLYALLAFGIVKVAWFDAAGSLLVKHLAFFFVPVAVGVMDAGGLLAAHGIGIVLTLTVSAVIGMVLCAGIARILTADDRPHGELS